MSRKGVGRGRRYTVRVNRDGSQQYARRSCLSMILAGVPLDERETEEVDWLRTRAPACNIWPHVAHDDCPGVSAFG